MTIKDSNQPYETRNPKINLCQNCAVFPPIGYLKNGNQTGNPNNAPRCGAKRRGTETRCNGPAMANGRCRLHGGLSTGPRTPEGLERSKRGNWKHGEYSQEYRSDLKLFKKGLSLLLKPGQYENLSAEEISEYHQMFSRVNGRLSNGVMLHR